MVFVFDAYDDTEAVIRVNDLVADFQRHGSSRLGSYMEGRKTSRQSHDDSEMRLKLTTRNARKTAVFATSGAALARDCR